MSKATTHQYYPTEVVLPHHLDARYRNFIYLQLEIHDHGYYERNGGGIGRLYGCSLSSVSHDKWLASDETPCSLVHDREFTLSASNLLSLQREVILHNFSVIRGLVTSVLSSSPNLPHHKVLLDRMVAQSDSFRSFLFQAREDALWNRSDGKGVF